jgi:hypothetical protein
MSQRSPRPFGPAGDVQIYRQLRLSGALHPCKPSEEGGVARRDQDR